MDTDHRNERPQVEGDLEGGDTLGHASITGDKSQAEANLDQAQHRLEEAMTRAKDKTEEAGHSLAGPLDE